MAGFASFRVVSSRQAIVLAIGGVKDPGEEKAVALRGECQFTSGAGSWTLQTWSERPASIAGVHRIVWQILAKL